MKVLRSDIISDQILLARLLIPIHNFISTANIFIGMHKYTIEIQK